LNPLILYKKAIMKLHIETLNITLSQPPAGLIAALAIAHAAKPDRQENVPAIGEKWPGLEAVYAGVALSQSEDRLVHLILWLNDAKKGMDYDDGVKWAEQVSHETNSHIPTRHQSITLFERLRDHFNTDYWHWTLTKTSDGKAAFCQDFYGGFQSYDGLSAEGRVRAVSEIPL
jgi:hypothetical protein